MNATDLKSHLTSDPFIPFRIHMTGGKSFEIIHPDQVLLTQTRAHIDVQPDAQHGIPDHAEYCSLLHVVRVEELPNAELRQGRQTRKRR
jgi:hypothetical protein